MKRMSIRALFVIVFGLALLPAAAAAQGAQQYGHKPKIQPPAPDAKGPSGISRGMSGRKNPTPSGTSSGMSGGKNPGPLIERQQQSKTRQE
jgi:hypothetical protein